jgi:hypothetical protein
MSGLLASRPPQAGVTGFGIKKRNQDKPVTPPFGQHGDRATPEAGKRRGYKGSVGVEAYSYKGSRGHGGRLETAIRPCITWRCLLN